MRPVSRRTRSSDAPGNAIAALGAGNLQSALDISVTVSTRNLVTMAAPGTPSLALTIVPSNGVVTGWFRHPVANAWRSVLGVVLQKQNAAFGYFSGVNEGGAFSLNSAN